jgi:hypothetical protein
MKGTPPSCDEDIWSLCGFAGELTSEKPPERAYTRVKEFRGIIGFGWVKREYNSGDFDCFDFEARYGGINQPPNNFGGFSGGGLWQVPLFRNEEGTLQAKDLSFQGLRSISPIV